MLEEDRRFAPELLVSTKNGVEFWRIDDRVFPSSSLGLNVPEESRDLTDVSSRVAHMDALGIDIQVLYPSLFLRPPTARSEVELALCRGYNRWLAQIWKLGNGRLRWVVLPPLRCMDRAIEEINFGKANGACGVFMRGFEGEPLLSDSSLFPVYEEAQRLDLPICIHAGTGNFGYYDQFGQDVFSRFKLPSVGAFNNLIYQGVPEKVSRPAVGVCRNDLPVDSVCDQRSGYSDASRTRVSAQVRRACTFPSPREGAQSRCRYFIAGQPDLRRLPDFR
jgi:predicted TIM-barrel fold metal-dependent hydrolase